MTEAPQQTVTRHAWRIALLSVGLGLIVLFAAYWPTVGSALHIWDTSSAYNHGYLIAPISLYLIWADRAVLRAMMPSRAVLGIFGTAGFGFAWLAADIMGINEGRHFAFVGMMQGIFLFGLGWSVYRRMAFPLLYLWLMVPTGEFLVEPLQHVGLSGSVFLLNVVGIPVFTEGWTIEVPFGAFTVERGCSGLNFVLAALALSLLFGKLNYRRWPMRVLAVIFSLVAAVVANIARIFLIVAITQWSERGINIADDHLLYGWIFFGIIIFASMWWGMRYADIPAAAPEYDAVPYAGPQPRALASALGALALALVLAAFPIFSGATAGAANQSVAIIDLPATIGDWHAADVSSLSWRPRFARNDGSVQGTYLRDGRRVDIAIAYCSAQKSGGCEASALENIAVNPDAADWNRATSDVRTLTIQGQAVLVPVAEQREGDRRIVASWYESAGCVTSSRLNAKICAARERLAGKVAPGAFIAISVEGGTDSAAAFAALEALAAAWPASARFVRSVPR